MIGRAKRFLATRKIIQMAQKKGCQIDWSTGIDQKTFFEGRNVTWRRSACPGSHLGYASYIGSNTKLRNTYIGRFTSIAGDVAIIFGNHPSRDYVSAHAAFYAKEGFGDLCYTNEHYYFTDEERNPYADPERQYYCVIGNDVWIGQGVRIKCGVKIGDGAMVGAYAVVTKDVAPYTIVGGVPAKLIRYRFEQEDIDWLLELQWWNRDENWLEKYGSYFYDVKELRKMLEKDKI